MSSQTRYALVVAFDSCALDCAVHPLDPAICPRMVRLGQPMLDPVCLADHVETHLPGIKRVPVSERFGEMDAVARGQEGPPRGCYHARGPYGEKTPG